MSVYRTRRRAGGDPTDRLRAVLALPTAPGALPALMAAVEDPSPDVARAALARLPPLAGPAEAAHLRRRLLEVDIAMVRDWAAALCALGAGDETMSVAVAGLNAPAPATRMAAAIALGEVGDPRAVMALAGGLADPIAGVRRCALDALALLGPDARFAEACMRGLRDADIGVRCAAVRALCAIAIGADDQLAPALADPSPRVRSELARHAPSLRAATAEAVLTDRDAEVRATAVGALVPLPRRDLFDAVVARLSDVAWPVRRAACRAVAAAGGCDAVGALVPLLADPHPTVSSAALNGLDETCGPQLAAVVRAALPAAGAALRQRLIYALERCSEPDAIGLLASRVDDPDTGVRLAVAFMLGELGGDEARRLLRGQLDDADWKVRCAAEGALARI